MKIYEASMNADSTEGRGPMVSIAFFSSLEPAVQCVQGKGVMGVGSGDVYEIDLLTKWPDDANLHYGRTVKKLVYGYRQDLNGKYGFGYLDNRDSPKKDPEYAEYERLKKKFEGRR